MSSRSGGKERRTCGPDCPDRMSAQVRGAIAVEVPVLARGRPDSVRSWSGAARAVVLQAAADSGRQTTGGRDEAFGALAVLAVPDR